MRESKTCNGASVFLKCSQIQSKPRAVYVKPKWFFIAFYLYGTVGKSRLTFCYLFNVKVYLAQKPTNLKSASFLCSINGEHRHLSVASRTMLGEQWQSILFPEFSEHHASRLKGIWSLGDYSQSDPIFSKNQWYYKESTMIFILCIWVPISFSMQTVIYMY